jgi:hypothetical protein
VRGVLKPSDFSVSFRGGELVVEFSLTLLAEYWKLLEEVFDDVSGHLLEGGACDYRVTCYTGSRTFEGAATEVVNRVSRLEREIGELKEASKNLLEYLRAKYA